MVVVLGDEESRQRTDFSDDVIDEIRLQILDHSLCVRPLSLTLEKHTTAVLRTYVIALSVELCGVVGGEEDLEEDAAWDGLGVVGDAHDFGVAGAA